jgi:hypothetical protein
VRFCLGGKAFYFALSWNANLAPNATTAFGFLGNGSGTNAVPTLTWTSP